MDAINIGRQILSQVLKGHSPDGDLVSLFISKVLGVGILLGACVTKLPQLAAVAASRSASGLSIFSFELENYVYCVHVAYGIINKLPITAFGEAAVMWAQNVVLLAMLYTLTRSNLARPALSLAVMIVVATPVALGLVTPALSARFYDANSTVYILSRLPQILTAFRDGRTGQLSAVTTFLQFAGSAVRIFTSIKESAGAAMVRGFFLGAFINGVVLAQIALYGSDGRGVTAGLEPQGARKKAKAV